MLIAKLVNVALIYPNEYHSKEDFIRGFLRTLKQVLEKVLFVQSTLEDLNNYRGHGSVYEIEKIFSEHKFELIKWSKEITYDEAEYILSYLRDPVKSEKLVEITSSADMLRKIFKI